MAAFEYRQAQEIRDALARHGYGFSIFDCRLAIGAIAQSGLNGQGRGRKSKFVYLVHLVHSVQSPIENLKSKIHAEGFPVCHLDDIIASKAAAHRQRDLEALPRLRAFREYWRRRRGESS